MAVASTAENTSVQANSKFQVGGACVCNSASAASASPPNVSCQAVNSSGSVAATGNFFDSTAVYAHTAPAATASMLPARLPRFQGATISVSPANASATAIHCAPRMRSPIIQC